MSERRPYFATMPTREFVHHLETHGLTPTTAELNSAPISETTMGEGFEISILEITGQRWGWSNGESSAK